MRLFSRSVAVLGAAALLAVSVPVAAQADPAPYTPLKPETWSATVISCTITTHEVPAHTFDGSAGLQLSVSGTSPAPTLAVFGASQLTARMVSDGAGGAEIRLDFGQAATGVYHVTLVEPGTENTSYGVVTVTPACDPADPASIAAALPRTGTTIDYRALWGAAGAVAIGLLLWGAAALRRSRAQRR